MKGRNTDTERVRAAGNHLTLSRAFTRLELMSLLAVVALLVVIAMPLLANTRERTDRIVCVNNLRQVGRAFHAWAADHADLNPWWVRYNFSNLGGTQGHPLDQNLWLHFSWLSNGMSTPKILACPSDSSAAPATDFSATASGLLHLSRRNRAISYLIGLDSGYNQPDSILSADRNVRATSTAAACSSGIRHVAAIVSRPLDPNVGWTNALHGTTGNILASGGNVVQSSSEELRELRRTFTFGGAWHFLYP